MMNNLLYARLLVIRDVYFIYYTTDQVILFFDS